MSSWNTVLKMSLPRETRHKARKSLADEFAECLVQVVADVFVLLLLVNQLILEPVDFLLQLLYGSLNKLLPPSSNMRFVLALCFLAAAVLADDSADATIKVKISVPDVKKHLDAGVDKIKQKWNSKDEDLAAIKEKISDKKDDLQAKWVNRNEEIKALKTKLSNLDLNDVKEKLPSKDDLKSLKEKASQKIQAAKEKLPDKEDMTQLKEKIESKTEAIKSNLPDKEDLNELKAKISEKKDDVKESLGGVSSKLKALKNKLPSIPSINAKVTVSTE